MSGRYIDFHTHILPGADHGSRSLATSLKQLDILSSAGIGFCVATPHFYPSMISVSDFIALRTSCAKVLADGIIKKEVPKIVLGAEILVCEKMEKMAGLPDLTLEGTNCLLLEMPFHERTTGILNTIDYISRSFTVVLAHIDRYPLDEVLSILECPNVFAQFNVSALTSFVKNPDYMSIIDCNKAVALGTDIHGSDEKAGKNYVKAIKKIGSERINRIISHSSDILSDAKYIN